MIDRRRFLKGIAAAAVTPSITSACSTNDAAKPLKPDANRILDLPEGFSYSIVSRAGDPMSDGLLVPTRHDGMAAFPGDDGKIRLVCNHELMPDWAEVQPFHESGRAFFVRVVHLKITVVPWKAKRIEGVICGEIPPVMFPNRSARRVPHRA